MVQLLIYAKCWEMLVITRRCCPTANIRAESIRSGNPIMRYFSGILMDTRTVHISVGRHFPIATY